MTAKNIDQMPHEFALLTDQNLRRKTLGDQPLKISGADFMTLEAFYEAAWENVHFYDCIFYGMTPLEVAQELRLREVPVSRIQLPGMCVRSTLPRRRSAGSMESLATQGRAL